LREGAGAECEREEQHEDSGQSLHRLRSGREHRPKSLPQRAGKWWRRDLAAPRSP
jgi:hypothetical protein